jgi:hypothetical protein
VWSLFVVVSTDVSAKSALRNNCRYCCSRRMHWAAIDVLPNGNSKMRSKSRPLTPTADRARSYVVARRICAGDVTIERMGFSLSRRINWRMPPALDDELMLGRQG